MKIENRLCTLTNEIKENLSLLGDGCSILTTDEKLLTKKKEIIKNTYAVYNRSSMINVGFAELKGKPLNTSFLLAPFWLKANIKNVMIYSQKLYT
jgi:hypothetical protein